MTRPALVALLPLLGPSAAPAAGTDGSDASRVRPWEGPLDTARDLARDRNVPLLVVVIQEGEEANDRFREGIWRHDRFVAAAAPLVVVLVNDGDHPIVEVEERRDDGEVVRRRQCSVFETPSCQVHTRNWTRVYQVYNQDGEMRTPQALVALPDGTVHGREIDVPPVSAVVRLIDGAVETAGPGLTAEALALVRRALDEGSAAEQGRRPHAAWKAYARVLELAPAGAWADLARAGCERSEAALRAEVEAAVGRMEAGEVEAGYERLLALVERCAGTPVEDAADDARRAAERRKEWRDAIEAVRHRREAAELWDRVLAELEAGRESAAKRYARKLLRKYADTPAGELARERFPDL